MKSVLNVNYLVQNQCCYGVIDVITRIERFSHQEALPSRPEGCHVLFCFVFFRFSTVDAHTTPSVVEIFRIRIIHDWMKLGLKSFLF